METLNRVTKGAQQPQGALNTVKAHDALTAPFDAWRKGKRLEAIATLNRTLQSNRGGIRTDVSYLSNVPVTITTNAPKALTPLPADDAQAPKLFEKGKDDGGAYPEPFPDFTQKPGDDEAFGIGYALPRILRTSGATSGNVSEDESGSDPHVHQPAGVSPLAAAASRVMRGHRARLRKMRERIGGDAPALLRQCTDIGESPIPSFVFEKVLAPSSSTGTSKPPVELEWFAKAVSHQSAKPPSRAEVVLLAKAMLWMHKEVDDAHERSSDPRKRLEALFMPHDASDLTLRLMLDGQLHHHHVNSIDSSMSATSGHRSAGEDRCLLDHLAVVDMCFAEIIRQVKVQCLERGAVLNHIREVLLGYVGDFLAGEKYREERLAAKEEDIERTMAHYTATQTALDEARQRIQALEGDVRRLDTLHKYTIAKHIREKQRLTRKHQRVTQSTSGTTAPPPLSLQRKRSVVVSDGPTSTAHDNSSDSDDGQGGGGALEDEDEGDSLSELVRRKRMLEPKARRESMANPLLVPSQLPLVRDRPRMRAVERIDAGVMTDPVLIRSKGQDGFSATLFGGPTAPPALSAVDVAAATTPQKSFSPQKPSQTPTVNIPSSTQRAVSPSPSKRARLPSVQLALRREVTHSYTQTDPTTPTPHSAAAVVVGFDDGNGDNCSGGAASSSPVFKVQRSGSVLQNTYAATIARNTADDIRRRMSLAGTKARATRTNVEVQATPETMSTGVQIGEKGCHQSTQTSVLLQLQLQHAAAATAAASVESVPSQAISELVSHSEASVVATQPQSKGNNKPDKKKAAAPPSPSAATAHLSKSLDEAHVKAIQKDVVPSMTDRITQTDISGDIVSATSSTSSSPAHPIHRLQAEQTSGSANTTAAASAVSVKRSAGGASSSVASLPATVPKSPKPQSGRHPVPVPVPSSTTSLPSVNPATTLNVRGPPPPIAAPSSPSPSSASLAPPPMGVPPSGRNSQPTSSTASSSAAPTPTPPPPKPKVRNMKWLLSSVSEMHFYAIREKITAASDVSGLLQRYFRGKYGVDRVADNYVQDLFATIKACLPPRSSAPQSAEATPYQTGLAAVPVAPQTPTDPSQPMLVQPTGVMHIGLFERLASDGVCRVDVPLHRRVFAVLQFTQLHHMAALAPDAAYHPKSYMFYLYVLECFRSKGNKLFQKDFSEELCWPVSPRHALQVCEAALKDRLPLPLLEQFLLGVQGVMLNLAALPASQLPAPRSRMGMYLPATHQFFREAGGMGSMLMHLTDQGIPQNSTVGVPPAFVAYPTDMMWDLDTLLEVLVLAYDTHLRPLMRLARSSRESVGGTGTGQTPLDDDLC